MFVVHTAAGVVGPAQLEGQAGQWQTVKGQKGAYISTNEFSGGGASVLAIFNELDSG